jgi:hypothetical protein
MISKKIKNHTIKETLGDLELPSYDKIYESWNNPSHKNWLEIAENNSFKVLRQYWRMEDVDFAYEQKQWTGYWFFKQRGDRRAIEYKIHSKDKESKFYTYQGNTLLLVSPNKHRLSLKNLENKMPDTPVCVITFDKNQSEVLDKLL